MEKRLFPTIKSIYFFTLRNFTVIIDGSIDSRGAIMGSGNWGKDDLFPFFRSR